MSKNINDLRDQMFAVLDGLRSGQLTVDQAKAAADIGQVVINSAKVEIQYMKETGAMGTEFIDSARQQKLPEGVVSITQHKLRG